MKKLRKPRSPHKHVEMESYTQEVSNPFADDDDINLYDDEGDEEKEEDDGLDFNSSNGSSPEKLDVSSPEKLD
jgi:hypothetical protein